MLLGESSVDAVDRWVPELKTSLEAKMTTPKPSYFRHIMRKWGSLEKTRMPRTIEGGRTRGDQI